MDVTVTALAAAGVKVADGTIDGRDLAAPASAAPHTFFWRAGHRAALRHGDWKLVREPVRGQPGPWQLYDLAHDLSEKNDLSATQSGRVKELVAIWEKWSAAQAAPLW
jgi:arylsulfatase A-like enzyme